MERKLLFVASSRSHILNFHLPYLRSFKDAGWTLHGAWGIGDGPVPFVDHAIQLPFEKKMSARGNFIASRILRRKIREEHYACVIVHTSLAAFFTRLAISGLTDRPKLINMVHGYLFDDQTSFAKRTILMAAEQMTAPVTDLLITMNQWDHQTAESHHWGKRVSRVPGIGVDFTRLAPQESFDRTSLRASLGIPPEASVLLYPAEFSARKSQDTLIRAMTRLPESVTLVLPGSGALLDRCMSTARELNVADRVVFPGYITDMARWYDMADIAISASRSEGLPFNVMEAMYCGLPVVASKVKGHTDLISDGETGLLYPYGDWSSCADQVLRLLEAPDLAHNMAQKAREKVIQYDLDNVFPQVMSQYDSVLN